MRVFRLVLHARTDSDVIGPVSYRTRVRALQLSSLVQQRFHCTVCLQPTVLLLHGSRLCCLCKKIVLSQCVTHDVARAFIFILLLPHERSTFVSLSSSSSTSSTSQVTLPINKHCDDPQNGEYGSVAKTSSSTTSTTQRLLQ